MKFKVAVVQFKITQWKPDVNISSAEAFIKKAVENRAKVIVFPEDFITGPIDGKKEFVDFESKYKKIFQHLAKKYKIDIVAGSWIEGDKTGFYNTCYYFDSKGKTRGSYRKINLWLTERKYLTYGNRISVFNTKFGMVGLAICWDLSFPEIFRKMAAKGARIFYCPSLWYKTEKGTFVEGDFPGKNVNAYCSCRAFENNAVLVYCNAAGKIKKKGWTETVLGYSQISMPILGVVKKLEHNKEEMFIQEIDIKILSKAEKWYQTRKDLKNRVLY